MYVELDMGGSELELKERTAGHVRAKVRTSRAKTTDAGRSVAKRAVCACLQLIAGMKKSGILRR